MKSDLLKNKYFLAIVLVIAVVAAVIYLANFNSVESKCGRYAQNLGSILGAGGNKLRDLQFKAASESLIQDCIKKGGPGN